MSKKFDEYAEEVRKKKENLQKLYDWKNRKKTEELKTKVRILDEKRTEPLRKLPLAYLPMGQAQKVIVEKTVFLGQPDTVISSEADFNFDNDLNVFIISS